MYDHEDLVHESYPKPGSQMADVSFDLLKAANDNKKSVDLGTGGFDVDKAWESLRKSMSKPTLTLIPGGKK